MSVLMQNLVSLTFTRQTSDTDDNPGDMSGASPTPCDGDTLWRWRDTLWRWHLVTVTPCHNAPPHCTSRIMRKWNQWTYHIDENFAANAVFHQSCDNHSPPDLMHYGYISKSIFFSRFHVILFFYSATLYQVLLARAHSRLTFFFMFMVHITENGISFGTFSPS